MRIAGILCETGQFVTVTVEGERIVAVAPRAASEPDASDLGGADVCIAPGFIDLQLNGYGGYDFNHGGWSRGRTSPESVARIVEMAARAGTALLCPTIVTGSHEAMTQSLRAVARAADEDRNLARAIPFIHLEGPYFSAEDGPRGAHPREHIRDPDWDEFQRFQEAAAGRIKIVTLAPERAGALSFIEKAADAGLIISIGHSGASAQAISDAVAAGARLSTHLGNGSHAVLPRHPNYIWEQLADDRLWASIIADGHHLPLSVVKCFARVKGAQRLVLVSDAVALGGCRPGLYDEGRHEVLPGGKVTLAGTPYLAGAGHLLDVCAANALRATDLGLPGVARAAGTNPAQLLGLERKGRVAPGHDADLTLFRLPPHESREPLPIVATLRGGEVVHRA